MLTVDEYKALPEAEKNRVYEQMNAQKESELKPQLTQDFLDTLYEAARVVGHGADYIATMQFVCECYAIAEVTFPKVDLPAYFEEFLGL